MNGLKKQQRIKDANGMLSLPTWPAQVTLRENVGSLDVLGRPIYSHLALGGRLMN